MRLARVQLDRYGPLAGVDERLAPGIQLIHGPNESGKTLLVEGLLALATGQQPADARVDGEAVGRLTVAGSSATDGGRATERGRATVDGETTLLDVYEERVGYAFTPAEFRNVFVIRDGDLAVAGDYYESVTQQLTGLRSEDIRALKAKVREEGRLTSTRLDLSGAAEHGDAASQRETAASLEADIGAYLESAREASLDAAERELFEARRRVSELETEVAAREAAVERDRIDSLRATAATLESALDERAELPSASVVGGLRRDLDGLDERAANEDALTRRLELYRPVTGLALLLAVLSVAAMLLVDLGPAGPVVPVVGVLAAAVAGVRWGRTNRRLAAIERDREAVLADARAAGLDPADVPALRATVADVAERRETVESTVDRTVGELEGALDLDAADPGSVLEAARARLDEQAAELPAATEMDGSVDEERVDGDEERLAARREALAAARERVAEREQALADHRDRLAAFERDAAPLDFERFTGEPLAVEVTSLEALATVRDRLGDLVDTLETEAAVARTAHDVLDGMAATEGEKVASLFGPDSRASEVFRLVTGERYDAVRYDADADSLVVTGRDEPLPPASLSQGTRDQLFFAVRVGLAEQLLGGRQGVLVLDDAFVAADPERLDRQVHVLERLADAGWQVLYLTAKADAVERLAPRCDRPVELDPL